LYRAVDKAGATVDFLLTAKRDRKAASRFLRKAIGWNGTPDKITIDKSGADTAAIESHNFEHEAAIEIRQIKYLNNPKIWLCFTLCGTRAPARLGMPIGHTPFCDM
jgi:putative transposase